MKIEEILSEADKRYNKNIEKVYEMGEDALSESLSYDERYKSRLKLLALENKDKEAIEEYTKLEEISNLSKENKEQLLKEDENGVLNLAKYNLKPHSNIYVLSYILRYMRLKELFKIEIKDGKKDYKIRNLGIEDFDIARILKDEKNKYIRNALLLEKIENEKGENIPAINYLFSDIKYLKQIICESRIPNLEILKNIIRGEYGDFGEETVSLIMINSNKRMLQELLKDEALFEGKKEIKEELERKIDVLKNLINSSESIDTYNEFKIPCGMTVGIELEILGPESNYLYGDLCGGYKGHLDLTMFDEYYKGVEIVSPVLKNDNIDSVFYIADQLINLNEFTNKSCGGHVHIGADYLTVRDTNGNIDLVSSKLAWKSFLELLKSEEEIMYKLLNKEGEEHRGIKYAKPLSEKINKMLNGMKINNKETLQQFLTKLKNTQIEDEPILAKRNFSINLENLNKNNKNTMEFRFANGTLDKNELKNNIRLITNFVHLSREIGIIEGKLIKNEEITEEEKSILEKKRIITTDSNIDEKQKMEILMELLFITDKEREVYYRRYEKSPFNMEKELEKLYREKEPDYKIYGEELTDEERKHLTLLDRRKTLIYTKEDFEELSQECSKNMPNKFHKVIFTLKRFIKKVYNHVLGNEEVDRGE